MKIHIKDDSKDLLSPDFDFINRLHQDVISEMRHPQPSTTATHSTIQRVVAKTQLPYRLHPKELLASQRGHAYSPKRVFYDRSHPKLQRQNKQVPMSSPLLAASSDSAIPAQYYEIDITKTVQSLTSKIAIQLRHLKPLFIYMWRGTIAVIAKLKNGIADKKHRKMILAVAGLSIVIPVGILGLRASLGVLSRSSAHIPRTTLADYSTSDPQAMPDKGITAYTLKHGDTVITVTHQGKISSSAFQQLFGKGEKAAVSLGTAYLLVKDNLVSLAGIQTDNDTVYFSANIPLPKSEMLAILQSTR